MNKIASLTPSAKNILLNKATEQPFSSHLDNFYQAGSYLCRACGSVLFRGDSKFKSSCGWPSFDEELADAITYKKDSDGQRTEITCKTCDAHLGHVFQGEGFTAKNIRHCVNGASIDYVNSTSIINSQEIILAAGCFWGVEYYLDKLDGVVLTEVGYCGGSVDYPSYKQVCSGNTGHLEVVRVIFDSDKISLEQLLKYFFEIHDPCQTNGQGPDIGTQYLSGIFYYNPDQQRIALAVIDELASLGYSVATKLYPATTFWIGEDYHHDYYTNNAKLPYCHSYKKIFR